MKLIQQWNELDSVRNKITKRVCDFMLSRIATREYKHKINLLIKQGMFHAQFGGPYVIMKNQEAEEKEAS